MLSFVKLLFHKQCFEKLQSYSCVVIYFKKNILFKKSLRAEIFAYHPLSPTSYNKCRSYAPTYRSAFLSLIKESVVRVITAQLHHRDIVTTVSFVTLVRPDISSKRCYRIAVIEQQKY